MTLPSTAARELIDAFRESSPGAYGLAVAVSQAVQVEPALLRRARLDLRTGLAAGAESDVWFSPLVGSRSARAIVFEPGVLELLRADLEQELTRECAGDARKLRRYRRVVMEVHAGAPPAIRLEEEIVWLALSGGAGSEAAIERALQRAIKTMVDQPERAVEVARWADRALTYFPASVRNAAAGKLLATGSAVYLGARARVVSSGQATATDQAAAWLAAPVSSKSTVRVRVRRFQNVLELDTAGGSATGPSQELQLAPADAVVVDLFRVDETEEVRLGPATPGPGALVPLPEGAGDLLLRTVSGEEYRLSVQETVKRSLRIFLSYLAADVEQISEIRRRIEDAGHETLSVDYQDVQGEDWEKRVAEAIDHADLFVYLVTSPSAVDNRLMLHELDVATERAARMAGSTTWIVPVVLEEVPVPENSPLMVRQWLRTADDLLDLISRVAERETLETPTPKKVFLSYNARDDWVERVKGALAPLESEGLLALWDVGSAGNVGNAQEELENTDLVLALVNDGYFASKEWGIFGREMESAADRGVPVAWLPLTDRPTAEHFLAGRPDLTLFPSPKTARPVPLSEMDPTELSNTLARLVGHLRDWARGSWEIPESTEAEDEYDENEEFGESMESEAAAVSSASSTLDWALTIIVHLARAFHAGAVEGPALWGESPRTPGEEGFEEERLLEFYETGEDPEAINDLRHVRRMCGSLFQREAQYFRARAEAFRPQGRDLLGSLKEAEDEWKKAWDASDSSSVAARAEQALDRRMEDRIERIARQLVGFADDKQREMMTGVLGYDSRILLGDGPAAEPVDHKTLEQLLEIAPQNTAPFHSWFHEFPTTLQRHRTLHGYLDAFCERWHGYCETALRQLEKASVRLDGELAEADLDRFHDEFPSLRLEAEPPEETKLERPGGPAVRLTSISLDGYIRILGELTRILVASVDDGSSSAA